MLASRIVRMHLLSVDSNASVLRSALVVWIILSLRIDSGVEAQTPKPTLYMLFLIPANTNDAISNRTASVIVVALKTIDRRATLQDFNVTWHLDDNQCLSGMTAKLVYDHWTAHAETTNVIFGGYCEKVCDLLAIISKTLNIPFIAIGCKTNHRRSHLSMPTFLTMEYYGPSAFLGLIALMKAYKWERVAIITTSEETSFEKGLAAKEMVEANGWTAIFMLTTMNAVPEGFTSPAADDEINLILEEIQKQARIVLFSMDKLYAARILVLAQRKGMYDGKYAFIGFDLTSPEANSINATEEEWKTAKVGLLFFSPKQVYRELENRQFVSLINEEVKRSYPQFGNLMRQRLDPDKKRYLNYAGDLYAALRVYAFAVNYMLKSGSNPQPETVIKDGKLLLSRINEISDVATKNTSVDENLGMLRFDANGVRVPVWLLMNSEESTEKQIFTYVGAEAKETFQKQTLTWPGKGTEPPLDTPECGWDDEKCLSDRDKLLIATCSILGFLALAGLFVAIYISRRLRVEGERRTLAQWRVNWPQVAIIGDNVVGRLSVHDAKQSRTSFEATSQSETGDLRSFHKSMTSHRLYTFTGTYKGKMVAIKKINRDTIDIFQPTIFNEIKQLFYISHANVNPFIGICSEAPNVCVLMLYADRGSLQDVLAETKYDINWEFRICLATDVAKGMEYLHESPIGPHGHLTSSNCVVDRKWECRITDYGLKQFKRSKNEEMSTFRWNSDLLWTAPEILEKPETDKSRIYGTKEGDVYSFGIIVYEIITKEMPYHKQLESIAPEDIIKNLKSDPQYRPTLPQPEGPVGAGWNNLANICWHHKPEVRPSFRAIMLKLRAIHGGKVPNLMERMQRMMEEALQRKSTDIASEKRRTETVVYTLLPQSVAEKIIDGKEIRPQRFETVTLCYCETSDVFATTKALSPIQVTDVMKSLFRLYDDVVKKYNVIEISGRGSNDSMIVGSGLPLYTEKHAEEICELSLDLISEALSFNTPLAPSLSLNLKISIHTGPVLTAVIWRTFPRYCVNGEAVDTVTAMQGASKAMRVRISGATYDHIKKSGSFTFEQGGKVTVKDGTPMKTFWLTGKTGYRKPLPRSFKRRSSSLTPEKEAWN